MATRRGGLVSAADSETAKQKVIAICATKRSKRAGPRGRITLRESLEDVAEWLRLSFATTTPVGKLSS